MRNNKTNRVREHQLNLAAWGLRDKRPDVLKDLGIVPYAPAIPSVVDKVLQDSPAARAGIIKGDHIIAVQGDKARDWQQVVNIVGRLPDKTITVTVMRAGSVKRLRVHTSVHAEGRAACRLFGCDGKNAKVAC